MLRFLHKTQTIYATLQYGIGGRLTIGQVQIDECYIGMNLNNKHRKERAEMYAKGETKFDNKTGVMGFITDDKKVRFEVMTDTKTFKQRVKDNVDKKSVLVTDSHSGYSGLNLHYIKHEVVNHFANEFKRGEYHTNSIENAWSNLKRTIKGTHIHVSAKYLQLYADEVAFRLMNKDKQDVMFDTILSHVV